MGRLIRLTNFRGVGSILTLIHTIRIGRTTLILDGDKRDSKICNKFHKTHKTSNHNRNHIWHYNLILHNLLHQWYPCRILHNQHHNRHQINLCIGGMRIMSYAWKSLIWNNNGGKWTLCLKISSCHNKYKGDSPLNPNKILSLQIALRKHMSRYRPSESLGVVKKLIKSLLQKRLIMERIVSLGGRTWDWK